MNEPRGSLSGELRSLPGPTWILFGGTFLNAFGSFVVIFLVIYVRSLGYSAAQAGLAVSAYGLGGIGASAVGGYLADRIGRRNTIALSMFASGGAMLALSQARGLPEIVLLTALTGLVGALYRPASAALLADLVPSEHRVAAFAAYRLAINAGFAFGPATAGILAQRSFFLLFAGDALTSGAFGLVALTLLPHGLRSEVANERRGEAIRAVLEDRRFLLFLLAYVMVSFVFFQLSSTFALHVRASGLSNAQYGLLVSMNGAIIVFFELLLVSFTRRLPARRAIGAGMILTGVGFGLTAVAHSMPVLVGTVVVWTLGEMTSAPVAGAYVADLAPPNLRGRYQGAFGLTFGVGLILAPALGTALYSVSPGALWALCAGLGVAAAALVQLAPARRVAPTVAGPEPAPELPGTLT